MKYRIQSGYSLIELSIGLSVLGAVVVAIALFTSSANKTIERIESPITLSAADKALVGFIAAKHRLPCPDTNGDGLEDCGLISGGQSAVIGQLPVVDLGLARSDMATIRYGVFNYKNGLGLPSNIDLSAANVDSFYPLLTNIPSTAGGSPSAITMPMGVSNGIDFCNSLRMGAALPRGTSTIVNALHIRSNANVVLKNVAYAISLPSSDTDPATSINKIANAFAAPASPVANGMQDSVIAMDFGQIFDRLSCAGVLASSSHAHPNVASAAAIMRGAMLDYKVQLDLQYDLTDLAVDSADVALLLSIGATASAAAGVAISIADTMATLGIQAPSIALAALSVGTAVAAAVKAGLAVDAAKAVRTIAQERVTEFSAAGGVNATSASLAITLRANAVAADSAGLYK
jgi:prepilin-type N-terminal cleavage/methylation domain-containing protein